MFKHNEKHRSSGADYHKGHAGYVSEFEGFMDQFLARHPDVERDQISGMNVFWNRDVDLDELEKAREDRVPVKNYYYF